MKLSGLAQNGWTVKMGHSIIHALQIFNGFDRPVRPCSMSCLMVFFSSLFLYYFVVLFLSFFFFLSCSFLDKNHNTLS